MAESSYEAERARRMAQNAAMMASLGLPAAASSIRDAWRPNRTGSVLVEDGEEGERQPKKRPRQAPLDPSLARRSSRFEGKERQVYFGLGEEGKSGPRGGGRMREVVEIPSPEELLAPWRESPVGTPRHQIYVALEGFRAQYELEKEGEAARVEQSGGGMRRPDIRAMQQMRQTGRCLNEEKRGGPVPGVLPGDTFLSRAELMVVGAHMPPVAGIDTMKTPRDGAVVGVSVFFSGDYEDNEDEGIGENGEELEVDELVYTGQGQNDLLGNKKQTGDQALERGNLALANSCKLKVPVRVFRKQKDPASYMKDKVSYTYLGLFKVLKYYTKTGKAGFQVYQFLLKKIKDGDCNGEFKDGFEGMYIPPIVPRKEPQDGAEANSAAKSTLKEKNRTEKSAPKKSTKTKKELSLNEAPILEEEKEFVVEELLERRINHGYEEFLIKWFEFDNPEDNTWEPRENLTHCMGLVRKFEAKYGKAENPSSTKKMTAKKADAVKTVPTSTRKKSKRKDR